jgi:HEPN domain-containing protein
MNRVIILYLFLLSATSVCAQNTVLDTYIQIALDSNLALQQKEYSYQKSLEALTEAQRLFFPTISFDARYSVAKGGRTVEIPFGDLVNPIYNNLNQINQTLDPTAPLYPEIENSELSFVRSPEQETKFGIFLTIASQRPSDISATIISQLHNFFLHRLINNNDIRAVEKTISYLDKLSFESLPISPTGTCIFAGLSANRRREIAETDFDEWFTGAKRFFENFQFNAEKEYFLEASFMLQQSIEMGYTTIEMVFSHYNPHEHNLFVLRDRCVRFHKRLKGVFHYDNEEHTKLFGLLNYAYIGGRYRNEKEFPVDMDKIAFWKQETEAFLKLTEEICLERIEGFKQMENK